MVLSSLKLAHICDVMLARLCWRRAMCVLWCLHYSKFLLLCWISLCYNKRKSIWSFENVDIEPPAEWRYLFELYSFFEASLLETCKKVSKKSLKVQEEIFSVVRTSGVTDTPIGELFKETINFIYSCMKMMLFCACGNHLMCPPVCFNKDLASFLTSAHSTNGWLTNYVSILTNNQQKLFT